MAQEMTFDKIARMLAEHLDKDVEQIKPESSFQDLGLDSLDTVELVMELEDAFGIQIELSPDVQCVKDLVAVIDAEGK